MNTKKTFWNSNMKLEFQRQNSKMMKFRNEKHKSRSSLKLSSIALNYHFGMIHTKKEPLRWCSFKMIDRNQQTKKKHATDYYKLLALLSTAFMSHSCSVCYHRILIAAFIVMWMRKRFFCLCVIYSTAKKKTSDCCVKGNDSSDYLLGFYSRFLSENR